MKFEDATRLLPDFQSLEGRFSDFYDSKIEHVYVTYKDGNLAEAQYLDYEKKDKGSRLPLITEGANEYTIAALLDNGDLTSVKSIVVQDKIQELLDKAEHLDYLQYKGGDTNSSPK
jgi:hypothetical protein